MTTTAEKVIDKRRALGRGLDSLLPGGPRVVAGTAVATAIPPVDHSGVLAELKAEAARRQPEDAIVRVPLDQIDENPYQTRRKFEEQALEELAESIRTNGIVQPIVVRPSAEADSCSSLASGAAVRRSWPGKRRFLRLCAKSRMSRRPR